MKKTDFLMLRNLYKYIIKEIPDPRISFSLLVLLRYNVNLQKQKPREFFLDDSFLKRFAENLQKLYLKTYNSPKESVYRNIKPIFISKFIILKIPVILNNNDDFDEVFWDFYRFLRNFYLVHLASKNEIVIRNPKKDAKLVKEMLKKRSDFKKEREKYHEIFEIPKGINSNLFLFNKDFYFEMKMKNFF